MKRLGDTGTLSAGETSIASAATTDLGSSKNRNILVTGTTAITSFGSGISREHLIRFAGVLTLTHNATSLILQTGGNITTAAGDTAVATSDAAGNWRVRSYQRADGKPLAVSVSDVSGLQGYGATQTGVFSVQSTAGALNDANAKVRYRRIESKLTWINYEVTVVNNGTGSGSIKTQLPFTSAPGQGQVLIGREDAATGKTVQAYIPPNTSDLYIFNIDNTYPAASGYVFKVTGTYEVA